LKATFADPRARAEASFKKKERMAVEGAKAMAEYQAQMIAVRERTARLRALRLAKEAEEARTRQGARSAAAEAAPHR
jgi:hypothetical protein